MEATLLRLYSELGKECAAGKCEGCGAREFCYTAPADMTEEIIQKVLKHLADRISGR